MANRGNLRAWSFEFNLIKESFLESFPPSRKHWASAEREQLLFDLIFLFPPVMNIAFQG